MTECMTSYGNRKPHLSQLACVSSCISLFSVKGVVRILIVLMATISPIESSSADDYLSFGQVAGISVGTSVIGLASWELHKRKSFDKSLIRGPLPGELFIMRTIGGRYRHGKTNFLDNHLGSHIAPVGFAILLVSADLAWTDTQPTKNTFQDIFLYGTGYAVTTGLTSIAKHTIRRPRPYTHLADSTSSGDDRSHRYRYASFFSGHSSAAFFSASFLNLRLRSIMRYRLTDNEYHDWRWAPPTVLFGWATLVAWSRIHAYKHYPSDVAVGALVGYLIAELFYSWGRDSSIDSVPRPSPQLMKVTFYL